MFLLQRNVFKVWNIRRNMRLNKRNFYFLFLVLFFPFVSAQQLPPVEDVINGIVSSLEGIFTPISSSLFGGGDSNEFLFAKILLAILLFAVINAVVKKVPIFREQKGVAIIVALVISILAVRFISENQLVAGILLPYGTLGVGLTTILPFLIFFYFIHDSEIGPFGRRVSWFFFILVFLILWYSKGSDLSTISNYIYMW